MLHDVEAIVLHDRLGDVELWVQDDTLCDPLAEANTKTLGDTLSNVRRPRHTSTRWLTW